MCVLRNQVNIDIAQRDKSEDEIEMKVWVLKQLIAQSTFIY